MAIGSGIGTHTTNSGGSGSGSGGGISISVDYRGYVDWVRRIGKAIDFFTKNLAMKSAQKNLDRLKRLQSEAMQECYTEFTRLMVALCKPIDLNRTPFPLPKNFELIASAEVDRLRSMIGCMDQSFFFRYLEVVTHRRAEVAKESLVRSWDWHEATNGGGSIGSGGAASGGGGGGGGSSAISKSSSPHTSDEKSGAADELVGGYIRGSHRAIFQTQFAVRALEAESELYETLFAEADNLGDARYEDGFIGILQAPIKTYLKQMAEVLLLKGVNKLLVLLDVLDSITHCMPRYKKVIIASNNTDPYVLLTCTHACTCILTLTYWPAVDPPN